MKWQRFCLARQQLLTVFKTTLLEMDTYFPFSFFYFNNKYRKTRFTNSNKNANVVQNNMKR